jgi:hypothetical protein
MADCKPKCAEVWGVLRIVTVYLGLGIERRFQRGKIGVTPPGRGQGRTDDAWWMDERVDGKPL